MSSAEGMMPPLAATAAAQADTPETAPSRPRRRLFRKYALLFIGLVAAALLITSGFDFWFSYQETKAALIRLQQEKAVAAAERIEGFVEEIERQIGWTTHAQWAASPLDQRRQDYFRLLRQVPAITEVRQLDAAGREQLKVSRLAMDAVGSTEDMAQNPAFLGAKADRLWFSPVYFRKQSEPYVTMAILHQGRNAGVTIAEINLKLIWDVINDLKIGKGGYAYVADGTGRLIAHPDISLVLRGTDLSRLPQVAAALASGKRPGGAADAAVVAENLAGKEVLSAQAPIRLLGWNIFVEAPLSEAFAPLYGAAWRTALLLVGGLAVAILLALMLARRMTGPIHAIAAGAERFGAGDFGRRIEVHTGDELEALAGQFNRMAGDLQKSYAELEQRVADRTAELSEALEQQTATAEVFGVINASPGDLAPVFDAMLEKAMHLCEADEAALRTFDGELLHLAAMRSEPDIVARLRQLGPTRAFGLYEPFARGERVAHYADVRELAVFRDDPVVRQRLEIHGIRTWLGVALQKDGVLLGVINVHRRAVKPFTDKQIALLQNFAAQAAIAMENARLITETREALEQQTATAEVLGVINASPGDLAPVFDIILEKAHALCGATHGALGTYDGDYYFRTLAARGYPEPLVVRLREGFDGLTNPVTRPLIDGARFVHIPDLAKIDHPIPQAVAKLGGFRTGLFLPLRKDGRLLGHISMARSEVRPFSEKEIALLQNFAAQAVIAMENARLITETREALEQQTATAEVLQVINASPGDLAPVFDAMLAKATRLCEAAFGQLYTYDRETFYPVAVHGEAHVVDWLKGRGPVKAPPTGGGTLGRIAGGEGVVHIADAREDAGYRTLPPWVREQIEISGIRTLVTVALRRDDALLGAISVYRQEARPFTEKQIALLQNFAAQAVIAIENARLLNELRERTRDLQESLEYQTATSDVLKVISRSPVDLGSVLGFVCETAARLCNVQRGEIFRLDGNVYRWAIGFGLEPDYLKAEQKSAIAPGTGTLVGRVALAGQPVQILNASADPLYEAKDDRRLMQREHTVLGVPLLRDGVVVGVICLGRDSVEPFPEKQIALVRTFADQAVIAIENTRLFDELRERTDELARSVEELKALSEVGQAVSSTLDIGQVLSTILNRSVALTGSDAGAIFRYRRVTRSFRLFEAVGWDDALTEQVRKLDIPEDATRLGNATERRVSVQVPDLERRTGNPLRDVTLAAGYRSVLIVPLVGPDRIFGTIVLHRRAPGEFPEASVRLMQTIASQSVLAIQNARLFREIAEKSEQLAEASRHKSQFLANMSHELRTPLNAILGYAELLADGIYGELTPRAAGVMERVQNNGKHLLALINDVLDLSKIEAGQLVFTLEDYSLGEVVRSVVSATEGMARNKGLALTAEIAPGLPTGHADARRLQQVLLNLVGNAVKFTDQGEVAIGAAAEGGNFVLSVRDTGPGIAPEDHSRIFEEFQQIDSSNTRKKGGTGLGLAISKRMVEMQGGTISVESELGKGATFRVVLPIHVAEIIDETAGADTGASGRDPAPALRGAA